MPESVDDARTGETGARRMGSPEPLLPSGDAGEFRRRWEAAQTRFVDEPRRAVEDADALVIQVLQRLADTFSDERSRLGQRDDQNDEADTEALRRAFQRYRAFFERLLSA